MAYKRTRAPSPANSQKRSRGGGHSKYISLGTELPEEDGDDGAFVPVWKQTVTDERGRRRLHGAFTGGFSAGYFNTVGSKEGWAPKTFVSSRSNRNKDQPHGQTQRAEDFMDEEDLAAAAESRRLETAQAFAGIGEAGQAGDADPFGLFLTQEETMGVKIAQKMGWRRDQGIGRKVRRNARLESGAEADDSSHLFAPQDARVMTIPREEVQRKGLGYLSEARLGAVEEKEAERSTTSQLHYLESFKKPSTVQKPAGKKSSFGVGVLNDTGSDDEDPYELGPKITFNKTLGKDKKVKKPSKFAKAGTGDKHVFVSKKGSSKALVSLTRPSMDGKPPLKGFTLATSFADLTIRPKYPPPKIPPGWKSSKGVALVSDAVNYQSVADAAKTSTLDAKGRSALLGETPLPGKSIFDFIPKEARDRLATLSGKVDLPQGLGQAAPEGHLPANNVQPKDLWSLVPSLDKSLAAGALAKGATGWMPYAEDLKKRARYVGFLELRAGLKDDLPERPSGISVSDWVKELQEFAHAAQVFKPTTGIMASRFTSSTASAQSEISGSTPNQNLLHRPAAKPEDPAEQAAKLGMYGAMTRSSFPFYPSRLLCKRFNVKPPPDMPAESDAGEGNFKAKSQTEEAVSKSAMDKMMHEMLTNGPAIQRPAWMGQALEESASASAATAPSQPMEHATVDVEKNEALSNERAPEDVFKAIFGDDDEDV
ncbi:Nn.00g020090.m01.CDS01 [Neocucurbitaria sp. VM-36]